MPRQRLAISPLTEPRSLLSGVNGSANKCYISLMTKRFEQAVAEIRKLPEDRQDQVAELLMELQASTIIRRR